ncbi:MAG: Ldh family oxidoreductase [Chloroflexota bacterium]
MIESTQHFSAGTLRPWIIQIFETLSVPSDQAVIMADSLITTSLRGVDTHGVMYTRTYANDIKNGVVNPTPSITVVKEKPATALIDGDLGLGVVVATTAMRLAMDKAKTQGVGAVGVRNSTHFGATALYPMMATAEGMVGLAFSNASPTVAPWGGKTLLLGTNPLAAGFPGGEAGDIILDMATTKVAWGKMNVLAKAGKKMPFGWATDLDGNPTDDPNVGIRGLMLPLGDHKGYGLALFIELICAALSGAAFDHEIENEQDYSHFFIAIDAAAFLPIADLRARVAGLTELFHESEPLKEGGRIYMPGEIEDETYKHRSEHGIPMLETVVEELRALGEERGMPFPM